MTEQSRHLEERLDQLDRVLYRNRHVVGPPLIGALLAAAALIGWVTDGWWVLGIVAVLVWLLATDHWLDLPSRREQVYAVSAWTAGGAWTVFTAWAGPAVWLWIVHCLGIVAFGIPWLHHRRVRRGVDVDRAIDAWGDGSAVGLRGTHARGTKAGEGWWSFKLAADSPGAYTLGDYRAKAHRIAAKFGVRAEAVSFAESPHEGEIEVTVRDGERDTLTVAPATEPASIIGARPFGATDSGSPIELGCAITGHGGAHSVAVGVSGSGKSGFVNLGAEEVAKAPDAILCMIDLSPGAQELKAWRGACYKFADTVAKAEELFDWINQVCHDRGRRAEGRLFTPDEAHPQISVWMDEGATFFAPELADIASEDKQAAKRAAKARVEKVKQGVRVYRKYGIDLHVATQYGNVDALGDATIQQQLLSGYALVFRCAKNTDPHRVVPASTGMQAGELPASKAGTCYVKGLGIDGVVQGRLRYQDDEHIAQVVSHWAPLQGEPEPELVALPGGGRDNGAGDDGEDTSSGGDGEPAGQGVSPRAGVPDFTTISSRSTPAAGGDTPGRLTPEESRRLIWDSLAAFPAGAGPSDIAGRCGKSVPLVKSRLEELRTVGWVHQPRRGRWQVVSPPDDGELTDGSPSDDGRMTDG